MYYFIVDSRINSEKSIRKWKKALKYLSKNNKSETHETFISNSNDEARNYSLNLCKSFQKEGLITIIGNERTLNEVLDGSCLDNKNISIAYIPVEKHSRLIKFFGLKKGYRHQLKRIFHDKKSICSDYGVFIGNCGNRRFVTNCGFGFNADLIRSLSGKKPLSALKYIVFFISKIFKFQSSAGRIVLNGNEIHEFNKILFMSFNITDSEGNFRFAPDADSSDGIIEVTLVSSKNKFKLLKIFFYSLFGKHVNISGVHSYKCKSLNVKTEHPMPVHTDGIPIGYSNDFSIRCIKQRLNFRL